MLTRLHVQNYALIEALDMQPGEGLNIITGETGAGKSILLGALSLILGARADSRSLADPQKKCIVEGEFRLREKVFRSFFAESDLDFEEYTLIRRELSPAGKSRAFVNDTPVNLNLLKELGELLIDIHSQHETLQLTQSTFQLKVIDTYAKSLNELTAYSLHYEKAKYLREELENLKSRAARSRSDMDYLSFQLDQLQKANLKQGEQQELEAEGGVLEHAEEIKLVFQKLSHMLDREEGGMLSALKAAIQDLHSVATHHPLAGGYSERLESVRIELSDLLREAVLEDEKIEIDPKRLQELRERLDLLYSLQQKHQAGSVEELLEIRDKLEAEVSDIQHFDTHITRLEEALKAEEDTLREKGLALQKKRLQVLPSLEEHISGMLRQLGMPHAVLQVQHQPLEAPGTTGMDKLAFLFSANKQSAPQELSRIASGGEMSRVMLALKSLLVDRQDLPTIIFDEIDAGVSGEIARKMGTIIQGMARNMQVLNITHLPQIASLGEKHYLVYKTDGAETTNTRIRLLSEEERVSEIAKLLSGDRVTDTAMENAKELLTDQRKK